MRVVVIGSSGHIGSYLVPALVDAGHDVVAVSRGQSTPYRRASVWQRVEQVVADRHAEDAAGTFGKRIADLNADVVIDLICFDPSAARQLAEALRDRIQHLLHCGTIWVHGPSVEVPTTESVPRRPFGDYGVKKAEIEAYLLSEARLGRIPATVLHPGHIVGPGWRPINPAGHLDLAVFGDLAAGREVLLPNFGLETLHHVHADDVARSFVAALEHRNASVGEAFHVVSPAAVTLRGYAEAVAGWYGQDVNLAFAPYDEWRTTVAADAAQATWDHIAHSPNCSVAKAAALLGWRPRHTSLEAVYEALCWLGARGEVPSPQ
ncbi:NAD-dependent epimerase/dehydratase family protein [Actinopolymorpha rutila]|uniref:Nucleoside-diphosphate-sugar epimerase n=1 Tax=Actinopolymorpha rutila TaxID=446787 RepID=A0A852ZKQ5_9ACTN|nr:NAD-dependent epimerase/dehydratase family protein [Actinopolymorpha rutila]NYH92705.1 nucleoside-diphosphate-sugar epimerase [Actinopolymorpha rutila]